MSGRERADVKARRYLAEGRLTVMTCGEWQVEAACKGDSGHVYVLGYSRDGWWCECPAVRCSHLIALQLVTSPRRVSTRPGQTPTRPAPARAAFTGAGQA
jgi:hypothetical protein